MRAAESADKAGGVNRVFRVVVVAVAVLGMVR